MKNSRQLPKVLALVSLVLFFRPIANAQSSRNPLKDLDIRWDSTDLLLSGTLENKSANTYACVRIEFALYTRPGQLPPGEAQRRLGVLAVEVRDLPPRMKRNYQHDLPYPAEVKYAPMTECSAAAGADDQNVILYDRANFEGPKRSFGVGKYRLLNAADFNDVASSIRVPPGFVAIVYEHADTGGGYGRSVDFMEEQPDLSHYKFDNQISYLKVFRSERRWVRNRLSNGSFEAGHFQTASTPQYNPYPLIAPPTPPNVATTPPATPTPTPKPTPTPPPPPKFCTLSGEVKNYSPVYGSTFTLILYNSDGSKTQFSTNVTSGHYTIPSVPEGTYELRSAGYYKPTRQIITTDENSRMVTCEGGRSNSITFKIGPGEG